MKKTPLWTFHGDKDTVVPYTCSEKIINEQHRIGNKDVQLTTFQGIETRSLVSHSTPCASPRMMIAGKAGAKVKARVEFLGGKHHLPILHIERI